MVGSTLGLGKAHAASNGKDVYFEVDLARGAYWLLAALSPSRRRATRVQSDGFFVRARPLV